MDIRQLATSFSGTIAAAGEFEHTVHILDLATGINISTFETNLDFGGSRLAISNDAIHCVSAAYDGGGITAYLTTSNGRMAWHRGDLTNVQKIKISADDQRVVCCFDELRSLELDRHTGETLKTARPFRDYWESPYEPVRLVGGRNLVLEGSGGNSLCEVRRTSFAILSVAFAPGVMCISESAGPVRGIDTLTGRELWRFIPERGLHFLTVGFIEHANVFGGVSWPYEYGGTKTLSCFNRTSGKVSAVADLGSCGECSFCLRGSGLLVSDGVLLDAISGALKTEIMLER